LSISYYARSSEPATSVIGKDGKIAYAYVGEDYTERASAISVLQALTKPDKKSCE
jgi:peroxiredoxin